MVRLGIVLALAISLNSFAKRVSFHTGLSKAQLTHEINLSNGNDGLIEFRFALPFLDVNQETDGFSSLAGAGLQSLEVAGNPELLTAGELIAVPSGSEISVDIRDQQTDFIDEVVIHPTQRKYRCHDGLTDEASFAFNSKLYDSNVIYPQSNIRVEKIGQLRDVDLYRVGIYPAQMDFAKRRVQVTHALNFDVHFRSSQKFSSLSLPSEMKEILQLSTINGQLFDSVRDESPLMLIVTADVHKNSLSSFVTWKKSRGMRVDVVSVTEAGRGKEEIQKFIQKYYEKNKPTYLLLVGNKSSLPTFMVPTASGNAASDYPYTLLAGNDEIPDVLYGRIVADNESEVQTQVERAINYEKSPDRSNPWFKKGTTIASAEGSKPSDVDYSQQIEAVLTSKGFASVDRFYEKDKTATAKNILGAVNQGRSWLNYIGHGAGTAWGSTNDRFDTRTIKEANNPGKLPVIIDVACQNGSWVALPKCFGKTWVTHTASGKPAGAVAYYGGSVNISWHPPAIMSVGIAKAHFEKNIASLGGSTLAGQLYLIQQKGKNKDTLDNLKWYNLFGDPSLSIRTAR